MSHAILLISCPDGRGITATITNFVFENNGNIVHADQHTDAETNTFFMRVEWSLEGFKISNDKIETSFEPIAKKYDMRWNIYLTEELPRVAVFVSRHLHCLHDLLYRHKAGQYHCEIPLIISNHADGKSIADDYGISYHEIPITKETKAEGEKQQIEILKKENINVIVLARYHQILSKQFIDSFPNKIINIHHSFLPAFAGGNPYRQAFMKGVKIIGATSHYVTEKLDEGPIIEQDTVRVSHRDALEDMVRKGEDLERVVLNRAVRWHLRRKILTYNNKTVIFD